MNELYWKIRGYYVLELTGASPQWALNDLTRGGISFWKVCWIDSFTVRICVARNRLRQAKKHILHAMCEVSVIEEIGTLRVIRNALQRPVLLVMVAITLVAAFWVPRYVLFYQVVGNETVSSEEILRAMEEIGVGFWKLGTDIKPQWVKDRVLNQIPDLEWLTITQNGCRAQVIVRERTHMPETPSRKGYANVIATRDGVITSQSVLAGQPLHKVGDTVAEGDVLVSGLVDLERTYLLQRAQAEIYARTWRKTQAVTPSVCLTKQYTGEKKTVLWLEFGEKRIKIFGNSGISMASCDKMSERNKLVLPGGLELPVSWIKETYLVYEASETRLSEEIQYKILQDYVREHAAQGMVAGQILNESWEIDCDDACLRLTGVLECHEMIAATVDARLDQGGIANDGENRERGENGADH